MIVGSIVLLLVIVYFFGSRSEGFQSGDATFTLYYADWCPHCKTVKPVFADWSKSGSVTVNGKSVTTNMVEESSMKDKSVPVKGYPTFLLKKADGSYVEFDGDRSPSGWEQWLAKNM
jgi:thiol-disulfide isomerase/thioredoxin